MTISLTIDESLDPLVLLPGLEGHQIHAPLPAVVPGVEPVPLGVPHAVVVVLPAEPVQVAIESLDSALVNSWNITQINKLLSNIVVNS